MDDVDCQLMYKNEFEEKHGFPVTKSSVIAEYERVMNKLRAKADT